MADSAKTTLPTIFCVTPLFSGNLKMRPYIRNPRFTPSPDPVFGRKTPPPGPDLIETRPDQIEPKTRPNPRAKNMDTFDFNGRTFKVAASLSNATGLIYASEDGTLMALVPLKPTGSRTSPIVTVCWERFCVRDLVCATWNGPPPSEDARTVLRSKEEPISFAASNLRWGKGEARRHKPLPKDPELRSMIMECAENGADAKTIAEALDKPLWIIQGILEETLA